MRWTMWVGVFVSLHLLHASIAKAEEEEEIWTVALISDMNGSYGSKEYNRHVVGAAEWIGQELQPDLVVNTGDMVAGQRQGLDYSGMWTAFHSAVTDRLGKYGVPMAITVGNHDGSGAPAFWEERVHFAREWMARRPRLSFVDDQFYPFYYAFELGPALFISLDGTQVGPLDEAQRDWVREVLARNQHKPVKFVFAHLPLYGVAKGRAHEVLRDERLEEIFEEFGVDMMMSGHHHAYYPGRRGETLYLHAACLGSGPRALLGTEEVSDRSVAVVRFSARGVLSVDAVRTSDFREEVVLERLPVSIGEGGEKIWRMDVEQGP